MSRSSSHPIQLQAMGPQDALVPLPPLQPPAVQNPPSHPWASQCGPPPWGLSCLLALQVGAEVQELVLDEGVFGGSRRGMRNPLEIGISILF